MSLEESKTFPRFAPLAGIRRRVASVLPGRPNPSRRAAAHTLPLASASSALAAPPRKPSPKRESQMASASVALADNVSNAVPTKPASDVLAGAVARAASQSTIHPLDTLKVRIQTRGFQQTVTGGVKQVASLYRGIAGAASGAGIAIGAYFAFYGAACNLLSRHTDLPAGGVAFVGGGIAAAGSSVVKVPIAVCIRSVQAGVYPNAFAAAKAISAAAGPRGLFTGYAPTLLEDVPDMAFKFAAYESLRQMHSRFVGGRKPNATEDFALGAVAGAFAAGATTPLDVIKTNMMCCAASRPTMVSAMKTVYANGGAGAFMRGLGPRAASNGVNSAVFFCFFEAIRKHLAERKRDLEAAAALPPDARSAAALPSQPLTTEMA